MRRGILLAVWMSVAVATAFAQADPLGDLKTAYAKRCKENMEAYGKALDAALGSLKTKGDLDGFLAVDSERKRLEADRTVSPTNSHPSVAKAALDHEATALATLKMYVTALDELTKKFVKEGRVEDAKAARAEKDRASAGLADLDTKAPKTVDKTAVSGTEGTSAAAKPTWSLKKVPNLTGEWWESTEGGRKMVAKQTGKKWSAVMTYLWPGFGDVRIDLDGTVSDDGKVEGKMKFIKAPAGWAPQFLEAQVSGDSMSGLWRVPAANATKSFEAKRVSEKQVEETDGAEPAKLVKLEIITATFGFGDRQGDITEAVRRSMVDGKLSFLNDASWHNRNNTGDPAPGVNKVVTITYRVRGGKSKEKAWAVGERIVLP